MKPGNVETSKGLKHIFEAAGYTFSGLKVAFHETAFCLEFIILVLIPIVGLCLGYDLQFLLLAVAAWLGVMCVELINTAIEAVVDLASPEYHELAKKAKDLGSAAVAVAVAVNCIVWLVYLADFYQIFFNCHRLGE